MSCHVTCLTSKLISNDFHISILGVCRHEVCQIILSSFPRTEFSFLSTMSLGGILIIICFLLTSKWLPGYTSCPSSAWWRPTPQDTSSTSRISQRRETLRTSPCSRLRRESFTRFVFLSNTHGVRLNLQDAAASPNPYVVDGAVEFTQNLFTGSNTQYTVWLRGDNMEGKNYQLGTTTDCTADPLPDYTVSSVKTNLL